MAGRDTRTSPQAQFRLIEAPKRASAARASAEAVNEITSQSDQSLGADRVHRVYEKQPGLAFLVMMLSRFLCPH